MEQKTTVVFSWQEVLAILAIIGTVLTGAKAWFLNEWRLDTMEQAMQIIQADNKVQRELMVTLVGDFRMLRAGLHFRGIIDEDGNPLQPQEKERRR